MDRTIKLKLSVSEEDKENLKRTITLFNTVFNEVTKYGFEHKTHSKVSIHHATYKQIREKYPELPSSLVQGARDVACEALKGVELKHLPEAKQFSSIRYTIISSASSPSTPNFCNFSLTSACVRSWYAQKLAAFTSTSFRIIIAL